MAGLTQAELARRAGTSQPAIARYESGLATPSLPTLDRLLRACNRRLVLATESVASGAGRGPLADLISKHRGELLRALRSRGARRPRIFGSVARDEETAESDIDILVDMPGASLVDIAGLRIAAAELLGVPVDVTTPDLLKPDVRRNAERDAVPL